MSERSMKTTKPTQWRSLNQLAMSQDDREALKNEFPEGASELHVTDVSRRRFLGIMGASAALAGAGLTGCMRKPVEHIVPYTSRPEDVIPGVSRYFATNLWTGSTVVQALVKSSDGRPTKIDGNPRGRARGASTSFAQAEILRMYDPDRSQHPLRGGEAVTWEQAAEGVAELRASMAASGGAGVALLVEERPSPSLRAQVAAFRQAYPQARVFTHDDARSGTQAAALVAAGAAGARVRYDVAAARVIVSLDSDFLHTEPNALQNAQGYGDGRRAATPEDEINRVYAIEPSFTVSGSNSDHHLALPASQVGPFAAAIAAALGVPGVTGTAPAGTESWVTAIAADLQANGGASLVVAGDRQPAWVHLVALAINQQLGNIGTTISVHSDPDAPEAGTLLELAAAIEAGEVTTLITVGVNPVYSAPGSVGFAALMERLEASVTLSFHVDETARASSWHIPRSHDLEAWGDLRDVDGRGGVQQPLIEPLYASLSELEFLDRLVRDDRRDGYTIVRETWSAGVPGGDDAANWNRWLHDGVAPFEATPAANLDLSGVGAAVSAAASVAAPTLNALEINVQLSPTVLDGRYANTAWMQEYPNPVTKLTWDNAAIMSAATADALGIRWGSGMRQGRENAEVLTVTVNGQSLEIPAFVIPGVVDNVIVVELGYGRSGRVAEGAGVDVRPLTNTEQGWILPGATVSRTGRRYLLASTQDHHTLVPNDNPNYARPLVVAATMDEFRADPSFPLQYELMPESKIHSPWTEPNPRGGQQWGMTIDLNTCIGCGACTIACNAENNIPVVGKSEVLNGREMHWIRIDRYFTGDMAAPEMVNQPLGCAHCETAPCEQVCPVAATVHSPDGLNDMVYNRCIGTRYCGNNCPYKVRRFNFFAYNRYNTEENELLRLQRNPDVTVRHRGVMEKCTYCVQRIQAAKIEAKVNGDGVIPDGAVRTACQQVCPTQAIVFGDINDPNSEVSRLKAQTRNYALLSFLNIKPRTTYLAKLRNPNSDLV